MTETMARWIEIPVKLGVGVATETSMMSIRADAVIAVREGPYSERCGECVTVVTSAGEFTVPMRQSYLLGEIRKALAEEPERAESAGERGWVAHPVQGPGAGERSASPTPAGVSPAPAYSVPRACNCSTSTTAPVAPPGFHKLGCPADVVSADLFSIEGIVHPEVKTTPASPDSAPSVGTPCGCRTLPSRGIVEECIFHLSVREDRDRLRGELAAVGAPRAPKLPGEKP